MGCKTYSASSYGQRDVMIRFSENDDDTGCLCTFPHNYGAGLVDANTVRSMALLGAAVAMAWHGERFGDGDVYLPGSLPVWVVDGINAAVPGWDEDPEYRQAP